MQLTFEEKLNKAYRKYCNAYNRARNTLDEITLLIQKRYPNLEATTTSDSVIFIDKENALEEYYGLEDIERRYERKQNESNVKNIANGCSDSRT